MSFNAYEELVRAIHKYERHQDEDLSLMQLCFANEINSSNNYYESSYKINRVTESSYNDIHFEIDGVFYDVFSYLQENTDINNLYQVIVCNNFYQVFKFKQDEYDKRKLVSEFEMPGKVYSFYAGSVIVVVGRGCKGVVYKRVTLE